MAAREELDQTENEVRYVDVQSNPGGLKEMLDLNGGIRQVPTIVEDGKAKIGYGGT